MVSGKIIVVTGAARGLGFELARQLSLSNTVFALVRNLAAADKLKALAQSHSSLHVVQGDITDPQSIQQAVKSVGESAGGKIDVLINNAGVNVGEQMGLINADPADLTTQLTANIVGPVQTTLAFLPLLRAGASPSTPKTIAFIGSRQGSLSLATPSEDAGAFLATYSVAKAGLHMAARKLANELHAKEGGVFSVLVLHPGWVLTDMGGPGAQVTPEDSVKGLLATLDARASPAHTGKFFTYENQEHPW
ncbi:hypothetical protein OC835_004623 [Tilletia horrida]|uniref:Uncharacterized protein n=1 Tax=Tilletia horrida TaxID=155126 RepID=A0AAN6JKN5_9BASI|nr:hypothetical protein OC835_004623 [Tilletia horrida]KAK0531670.1 hypothetical protein OC842_003536 [Tilletia horrida]